MEGRGNSVQQCKEVHQIAGPFANVCADTINTNTCEHISKGKLLGVLHIADLFHIWNPKFTSTIYLPIFNYFQICRTQKWQKIPIWCLTHISGCWEESTSEEKNNHTVSWVGISACPSWGKHPTPHLLRKKWVKSHTSQLQRPKGSFEKSVLGSNSECCDYFSCCLF